MVQPRYKVPVFNRMANVWRNGNPTTNPADLFIPCQLTAGRRSITPYVVTPAGAQRAANMYLMVAAGTDIRDDKAASGADTVECPAFSGRFYTVRFVDDIGLGFLNEHRFAQIVGTNWPQPFPPLNSQYPLPGPLPLGSGGSLGVPVGGVGAMVNPGFAGILVAQFVFYNQAVAPAVTFGGVAMNLVQQFPVAPVGGVTADIYQFWLPVVPGVLLFQILLPFGLLGELQYDLFLVQGGFAPTGNIASAQGVAPAVPTITPVTITSYGECVPACFALLAQAGVAAYGVPFVFSDVPVFDNVAGVFCAFATGHYMVPNIGIVQSQLPLDTSAGWGGICSGYF